LAGDKALTEGEGNGVQTQKGARLQKAVTELRAAEKVFPLAASMIEGLAGAKEAAVEEMKGSLASIRSKATGLEEIGKDVRDKAAKIEEHAARVSAAEDALGKTGRELEEKATSAQTSAAQAEKSAQEISNALSSLKITVGKQEFSGVKALEVLSQLVTGIPKRVQDAVEKVVSAEVEVVDGEGDKTKVVKKGADLISHLVLVADSAEASAGKALDSAEHAESLLEDAGRSVNDSNDAALRAEESAHKAEEKAEKAAESAGLVEDLRAELDKTKKALDVAVGMIMTVLNKSGLDTEVTPEEKREIIADASTGDFVSDILTVEEDTSGAGDSA
jgi:hypothetical protein